ncbi:MAG: OmpA family protein, partial [Myxococcaceae bacterium]
MKTAVLSALLLSTAAFADAVEVSLKPRALLGEGLPSVQVHIVEPILGFELKLKRSDGKDIVIRGGGRPGITRSLELAQPEGKFGYTGELTISRAGGELSSMPLQFDGELYGPLRLTMETKPEDIERRQVFFKLSRPVQKVHMLVLTEDGQEPFDQDINFNGEAAGTRIELDVPKTNVRIMKIDVRAYDTLGFYTGFELYPWQIDVPHQDVNFDTGKWEVRPVEAPKLDKAYEAIADSLVKYGRWAD